jgi:small subunit ribosomal protein S18
MRRKTKKRSKKRINKPSFCYFTKSGTEPNYKEVLTLRRFISDRGKVLPQKVTGLSAGYQRKVSQEIKKARYMALLPYTEGHAI